MSWKPHTELPDSAPQAVLIAHRCPNDGEYFLSSEIYVWSGSCFKSEVLEGLPK